VFKARAELFDTLQIMFRVKSTKNFSIRK